MSHFRTRRVRTKYLKRAKKRAQIMKNAKLALRRQNWFISDADSDILLKQRTLRYEDFTHNKFTLVDNIYQTTQTLDTCSYYDTTIKLQERQQQIPSYPVLVVPFQHQLNLDNLKIVLESGENKRSLFGILFFGVYTSFFFKFFNEILRNLPVLFRYEQVFISQNLYSSLFPLTSQDSRFMLVTPNSLDIRDFYSDINFFLLLSEALFILEEIKFFSIEKHKMLFLGFVVDGIFYTKYMLLKKIKFLNLFCGLSEQFIYLTSMRVDKQDVLDISEKLFKTLSAKDNELFMEIDIQKAAEDIQKADQFKHLNLQSRDLLSKIDSFQDINKRKQNEESRIDSLFIYNPFMQSGVIESLRYDFEFFFGFF